MYTIQDFCRISKIGKYTSHHSKFNAHSTHCPSLNSYFIIFNGIFKNMSQYFLNPLLLNFRFPIRILYLVLRWQSLSLKLLPSWEMCLHYFYNHLTTSSTFFYFIFCTSFHSTFKTHEAFKGTLDFKNTKVATIEFTCITGI